MARRKLKPVTIFGIEFDALIEDTKTMNSSIPTYPVEEGFPVSDTIINEPISLSMTLFISNTPVTWRHKHKPSNNRVRRLCALIEKKWFEKKLTKIVTTDAIYTDMGITSVSIRHSSDTGYDREVSISAQKVYKTKRKTTKIPAYIMKSGKTKANAGSAAVSKNSSKSTASGNQSGEEKKKRAGGKGNVENKNKKSGKKQSTLYKAAKGLGLLR